MPTVKTKPRGVRNNNPGNLDYRESTRWQGLAYPPWEITPEGTRGRFCRFKTAHYGLRALCKVLLTYQRKHGLRTTAEIIMRWSPPAENDTASYAKAVAKALGRKPADVVIFDNALTLAAFAKAIARHENGGDFYADTEILHAAVAALKP